LLEGYRGLLARKDRMAAPDRRHLGSDREWIVEMYEARGKPEEAVEWRQQ
jgi:hypothetical protein